MPNSAIVSFAVLAAALLPIAATGEDVSYRNGDITLAAEWLYPEGTGPWPAVVVAQGAGDSDRSNAWSRQVAELFVANGVAALLTDKRGSGKSGGDWRNAGFDDLAGDVIAGVRYAAARDDTVADSVGVVGLSQGGRVVPIAAATCPCISFVVNVSGDAVSAAEQSFHEMRNTARQAGVGRDGVAATIKLNAAAGRYAMNGDWEAYAQARADALDGPAAAIAEGFPAERDAAVWSFIRQGASFNPLPYWLFVTQPVLVLYGELDEQDNVAVHESVRRLEFAFGQVMKENYEIAVIEGANHAVRIEGEREIAPRAREILAAWIDRYVSEPR